MAYKYPFKDANEQIKLTVWKKGRVIVENGKQYDPAEWRHDICGNAMQYSEHGNTNSKYGWEIDHIKPTAKGGKTTEDNLQPLHWANNRKKGDTYPWSCS